MVRASVLSLPGVQFWSLVGELGSCKPWWDKKKKNNKGLICKKKGRARKALWGVAVHVVSRLWLNCSALLTSTKWGEQSMSPQGHRGDSPPLRVSVWDQPHNRNAERGPLLLSLSSLLPSKPRKERQDLLLPLAAHASRQRDAFFPFILKIGLTRLWGFRQRGLWIHLWCH